MTDYKCRHLDWCDDGCQQRVAELEGRIEKLQQNENRPSANSIVRLCSELGVTADWLLGLSEEGEP